jgi:hypothetical protein
MIAGMWNLRAIDRFQGDALALQAERAGYAMACSYSSSDEFEAAVIRSKLDAGIYGPKRRRRFTLYAVATVAALLVVALLLV